MSLRVMSRINAYGALDAKDGVYVCNAGMDQLFNDPQVEWRTSG